MRLGLLEEEKKDAPGTRPFIRRSWTPEEADAWSREDWIAIVLSPIAMALGMVGTANVFLGRFSGAWQLGLAVVFTLVIFWVIDPKLRAVSVEYEQQQARYLARLERQMRWHAADEEVK